MAIKDSLLAPDYVLVSGGVACGDRITLFASEEKENGVVYFSFFCESCTVSKKISCQLESIFSGKKIDEILCQINAFRNSCSFDNSKNLSLKAVDRKDACQTAPILLLIKLLHKIKNFQEEIFECDLLACDACVKTQRLNWGHEPQPIISIISPPPDGLINLEHLDNPDEIFFQRLGLAGDNHFFVKNYESMLEYLEKNKFHKLIKKLRLAAPIYNNCTKWKKQLDHSYVSALAIKQAVSLSVAHTEISQINQYIKVHSLKICAVKGQRTKDFYPQGHLRTHMDFDYLATNIHDAFAFVDFLLNKRNFRFVTGGSVPFSFKIVRGMGEKELLTGHIHLEKILQDSYQVVIDINIGSFPLGRVAAIECNSNYSLDLEDEICITMAHVFKHEHAYIKDINDLYYIFKSKKYDKYILSQKITQYELSNEAAVIIEFLKRKLKVDIDMQFELPGNILEYLTQDLWPYSRKNHFLIKKYFLEEACKKQFGVAEGAQEAISQIQGMPGKIQTTTYNALCDKLNNRTYLYPIAIFNRYIKLDSLCDKKIHEDFIISNHIAVFPIGLFLLQKADEKSISRKKMLEEVQEIIDVLKITDVDLNLNYIAEARKDLWLY